jgi:hypothetical protein
MKRIVLPGILFLCACLGCGPALCQPPVEPPFIAPAASAPVVHPYAGPVDLNWVPPALEQLRAHAAVQSSFTLDRNLLAAAAGILPDEDSDVKQTIAKLDGLSFHLLRFGSVGIPDEAPVNAIRDAYHLRGWKHLVSTTSNGGPLHNETTDVWIVVDGANLRGAVILSETPKSLTLVTMAGNLNPIDLLRLRGRFGIPRFDGDNLKDGKDKP